MQIQGQDRDLKAINVASSDQILLTNVWIAELS